jgi:predicted amidophosphoribosyltransferase
VLTSAVPYKDRDKQQAYQREWKQKAVAQGLCRTCRAPRRRSKYAGLCTRCGKAHRASNAHWSATKGKQYQAARRQRRIEAGLCPNCGKPAITGTQLCATCRARENVLDRERRRDARTWWSARARQKKPEWWRR